MGNYLMSFEFQIPNEGLDQKLNDIATGGGWGDIMVAALNTGNGLMQQRIFQKNQDVEGHDFGRYVGKRVTLTDAKKRALLATTTSRTVLTRIKANINANHTPYERKRVFAGRQIEHKDLEFSGNLRKSIQVMIENQQEGVIEFNDSKSALIARGQENQITNLRAGIKGTTKGDGIRIFAISKDEEGEIVGQIRILLNEKIAL